ncbi:MAG: hypothetical protein CMD01_01950 [Flavobacteriales bacterium]|nr:hypothetical protein [Flavobacteriales bacterium]
MKLFYCCILTSFALLVLGCGSADYNQEILKPNSRNNFGDLLVVLDKKFWNNSTISHTVKKNFGQLITTTPLPYEPEFNVEFVDQAGVNTMIKRHKTILIVNIDPAAKKNSELSPSPIFDLWAKNQIVYKINATSEKNAVTLINHHADSLKLGINQFYHRSFLAKSSFNNSANKLLEKNHSITLSLPSNMKVKKSNKEFTWLNRTTIKKDANGDHEIQQGLFIYTYPYVDEKAFSNQVQVNLRDSLLKKYVHGTTPKSYMTTRKDQLAKLNSSARLINNKYIYNIKGLWRVENDKMGGPFSSISAVSEDGKNVVTIEGYVYAPNFGKRELIRELEAYMFSYKSSN